MQERGKSFGLVPERMSYYKMARLAPSQLLAFYLAT